jgi:D-alanyl-D-alanine carboxypeptidase
MTARRPPRRKRMTVSRHRHDQRNRRHRSRQFESLEHRTLMATDLAAASSLPSPTDWAASPDAQATAGTFAVESALRVASSEFAPLGPFRPPAGGAWFEAPNPGQATDSLRELDVAHLGGDPSGPLGAYLVSAVGTGAAAQLTSWKVTDDQPTPSALAETDPMIGQDVSVHVLSPAADPELARRPFIASRIGADGNLWLDAFTLGIPGNFVLRDTRGFGSNADVSVRDHAVAHRPTADGADFTQVVTPIVAEDDGGVHLRIVTWNVDVDTHSIQGLHDSGPLDIGEVPADGSGLTIHHSTAGMYVVNYTNVSGELVTRYFGVFDSGQVLDAGGGDSGNSVQGDSLSLPADRLSAAPLNSEASVALTADAGQLQMTVWDRRVEGCFFLLCTYEPYQVGTSDDDERPNSKGIAIPAPELTHAYATSPGEDEYFGTAVATGDLNGDGYHDLIIGAPGQAVDGHANAGAVTVIYSSADGPFNSEYNQTFHQNSDGIPGVANDDDQFGRALAVGDFNDDGYADVAIGVPGESDEGADLSQVGVVQILYGSNDGLTTQGSVLFQQGQAGVEGVSEAFDQFGWSMTTGDFNDDGFADLVVGTPLEDHNQAGIVDGGTAHVFYGSATGLSTATDHTLHQDQSGMFGAAETNGQFGFALASGDFDDDGFADLAIGVPGQSEFGMADVGGVQVVFGSASGLDSNDQFVSQDGIVSGANGDLLGDLSDSTEEGDRFGQAIAVGDFDGDGFDDLAIGAPDESLLETQLAGRVHMVRGSSNGLTADGEQTFDQTMPSVSSTVQTGSRFGFSLSAGDVNGDARDDLLVGIPYEDTPGSPNVTFANSGVAVLIPGSMSGLSEVFSTMLQQGTSGLTDEALPGEHFAHSVALGDINGDGFDDALIGVPNQQMSKLGHDYLRAGAAHIVYGDATGLTSTDEVWGQGVARHIRARLADADWENQFGIGGGTLFDVMPEGEPLAVHAASVTKVMTLLLAVEALELPDSPVALSDLVTISELAGTTGGSKMEGTQDGEPALLEPDDVVPLETLLYGMMIHSGNRASVAIAEHIAVQAYGADPSVEDEPFNRFVEEMNARAEQLFMSDSRYGHPAGGSVTTPQDLITLWREGWRHTLFRQFANAVSEHDGGTVNLDPPKLFHLERNSTYLGHDGWKGGHGRVGTVLDEEGNVIDVPNCEQCHVGQATRAGHSLVVGIQQSQNDWSNAVELFDYGFQRLFTADRRGHNDLDADGPVFVAPGQPVMGSVQQLALDDLTENWIVSAAIDANNHLQLQTWDVDAGAGSIEAIGQSILTVDYLGSAVGSGAANMDLVRIPAPDKVLADYVSGTIDDGQLRLDIWRLGAELAPPQRIDPLPGDLESNPSVDEPDIASMCEQLHADQPDLDYDLNGDGVVDPLDLDHLVHEVLGTTFGDANLDGIFNSADLVEVFSAGEYEDGISGNSNWAEGDWNCDSEFDTSDLIAAFQDGGYTPGAQPAAARWSLAAVGAALNLSDDEPQFEDHLLRRRKDQTAVVDRVFSELSWS